MTTCHHPSASAVFQSTTPSLGTPQPPSRSAADTRINSHRILLRFTVILLIAAPKKGAAGPVYVMTAAAFCAAILRIVRPFHPHIVPNTPQPAPNHYYWQLNRRLESCPKLLACHISGMRAKRIRLFLMELDQFHLGSMDGICKSAAGPSTLHVWPRTAPPPHMCTVNRSDENDNCSPGAGRSLSDRA